MKMTFRIGFVAALLPASVLGGLDCTSGFREFNPSLHKKTYYIGLHAPGGVEVALREYNLTFDDYLTATAGQRFDPPIEFKIKPTTTP